DGAGPIDEGGASKREQPLNPISIRQDSVRQHHGIATALPPIFNHQPNMKNILLHASLLTKNFEGDQQFFSDGGHTDAHPASTSPSYPEPGDPLWSTHVVPHEDAPAFSDIATTVMTTASPTSPGKLIPMGQNRPIKKRTEGMGEVLGGQATKSSQYNREQYPMVDFTKKDTLPGVKGIVGNPADTDGDTTMTSIIHTTTVISTMREQGQCSTNLTDAEGYIEMPPSSDSFDSSMDCTYFVTVYLGYGVEIQVLNVTLVEGENVVLEDLGGLEPSILANKSGLVKGLVVKSSSNQISIHFTGEKRPRTGSLLLRYR
ncbi:seizure protein 6, partial [Clarias magur]